MASHFASCFFERIDFSKAFQTEHDGLLIVATIIDMIETAIRELHSSKIKKVSIMAMQVSCEVRRLTPLRCLDALKSL